MRVDEAEAELTDSAAPTSSTRRSTRIQSKKSLDREVITAGVSLVAPKKTKKAGKRKATINPAVMQRRHGDFVDDAFE